MGKSRLLAMGEAFFAVIAWGASFVATKVALRTVSPVTVVWLRFALGFVILGLAVALRRQFALPQKKEIAYFASLGFLGIAFHQWLQSTGLLTAQATTTAWIIATTPVFMALLGWVVLREGLHRFQVMGIILAAFGVLLVVSGGDFSALAAGDFGTVGDLLILISALNWAIFSTLSRRGLQRYSAALMMLYVMGFGLLFTSLLFFSGPGFGEVSQLDREGWIGVCFLGVFCSGFAYIFWYDALQKLPVAQAGSFLYFEPLVTLVVAAWVLHEPLIIAALLGGATILLGVWLVNRPSRL